MYRNTYLHWLIIFILTLLQVIRLVTFISVYGGLGHDSGWVLGTARTLAKTGKYATMVSTIVDPSPGGHLNVYGRYKAQDEAGRVYFSPDSIGPGSVIPNAIIIKLLGPGFWQYRTGPLLFFIIAFLLAAFLLYRVGGLLPVIITYLFLFFYPHLIIYLGYEALGEIYGLAYMLLAFVLFNAALQANKYRWLWFLGCGLAAGLMIATKAVGLLALSGLVLVYGLSYWEKRMAFKEVIIVAAGWLLPTLIWELFQFFTLTLQFNFQTYQGYKEQLWQYFVSAGSGVNAKNTVSLAFMWEKLLVIKEIASPNQVISVLVFLLVFLSGPFLIWRFYKQVTRRNIIILFWSGWFITSLWFIILSENGWVRHDWYALILGVFLLSLLTTYFWQHLNRSPKWIHRVTASFLTGLLLIGFIGQINTPDFFTSQRLVERWYELRLAANHSRIPWVIIPRAEQDAALNVLRQLPPSAHLFYPGGFKSAEMAASSGRMIYSLERRSSVGQTEDDVVLFGPDLVSPWAKLMEKPMTYDERKFIIDSVKERIKGECPQIIFENNYYIICSLN